MNQRGFTIIEGVLIVAVLVILGGVGFVAYNNFVHKNDTTAQSHTSQTTSQSHDMSTMPTVNTTKDLDQASASLDDTSFDNDGLSAMDSQAATFQ